MAATYSSLSISIIFSLQNLPLTDPISTKNPPQNLIYYIPNITQPSTCLPNNYRTIKPTIICCFFCPKVHIILFSFHTFIYLPDLSPISSNKKHLTIFYFLNTEKDLKDQFQLFVCEPITCEQHEKEEEERIALPYITCLIWQNVRLNSP